MRLEYQILAMTMLLVVTSWNGGAIAGQASKEGAHAEARATIQSPVDLFRQLLALDEAGRKAQLKGKSRSQREYLLRKLAEYEQFSEGEREARLREVEFQWYLRKLMMMPVERRAQVLDRMPAMHREPIRERLTQWDLLPGDLQKEVLENEWMVQAVLRLESSSPKERENLLRQYPREYRLQLEERLQWWRGLPKERQTRMSDQFQQFFTLSPAERGRILKALPEEERKQMERTLESFSQLPPEQREACIHAFWKFAAMTPEEREEFLKNAERWQAMTPEERGTWRNLVNQLPPLPDGFPLPPLPPEVKLPPLPEDVFGPPAPGSQAQSNR